MSTDTMYLNSSRRLPAAGKNKSSQLQKPEKKQTRSTRKNRTRQEASAAEVLPKPQTLPNGEKPDFGNSSKKQYGRKNHESSSAPRPYEARESAQKKNRSKDSSPSHVDTTPAKSPSVLERSAVRQLTPQSVANASPVVSPLPLSMVAPLTISPLPHQPGLYQQQHQQNQFQQNQYQQHQQFNAGYPYHHPQFSSLPLPAGAHQPNYALSTGAMPYFTSPQAPLMGLPAQQAPPFFGMPHPPPPVTIMPGHFPHTPPSLNNVPPPQMFQQTFSPASAPTSISSSTECSGPVTALPEEPRSSSATSNSTSSSTGASGSKKPSKKTRTSGKLGRGGYAGASFATSLPSITNLPKPSFT
ncbi:EDC1-like protein [Lachancea thermotolerans]